MIERGRKSVRGSSYLSFLAAKARHKHPVGVFLDGLARLGLRIVPFRVFARSGQKSSGVSLDTDWNALELGYLVEADMEEMAAIPFRSITRDDLRTRLREGSICLAAREAGRIVGFVWADLTTLRFGGYRFELAPNEVYFYDAYVSPELRGQGLLLHLSSRMSADLARGGRTISYRVVNRFNTPAIAAMRKLGNVAVASGCWVRLWGRGLVRDVAADDLEAIRRRLREARTDR